MRVVIARPSKFSSTDKMTYQGLQREGIEVTVATELQSVVTNATAVTFRHPDEILDLGADIIDCADLHYALTMYLATHLPSTTRLVCTAFDNLPGKNWGKPMQCAPRVDLFVARSKLIRNTLWWDGIAPERIKVVNPAVDTSTFEPLPFVPQSRAVLFVGRLIPYKGLKDIIIALKGLHAELWVAGEGSDQDKYQALADALGVSIKFLGHIPHGPELAQLYREAMIFCSPSFPVDSWDPYAAWMEQWGSAVMEAMASGLPVITTDIGSFPEFVEQGHNGYLVPARNWYALHSRLALLLEGGTLRENMGANGRELMERRYSSEVIGDRLAEIYAEVLDGRD